MNSFLLHKHMQEGKKRHFIEPNFFRSHEHDFHKKQHQILQLVYNNAIDPMSHLYKI